MVAIWIHFLCRKKNRLPFHPLAVVLVMGWRAILRRPKTGELHVA
jgi:hypothetical protein